MLTKARLQVQIYEVYHEGDMKATKRSRKQPPVIHPDLLNNVFLLEEANAIKDKEVVKQNQLQVMAFGSSHGALIPTTNTSACPVVLEFVRNFPLQRE